MLHAHPFRAAAVVADDLALVVLVEPVAEKSHDVAAVEAGDCAADQLRIDRGEGFRRVKHRVGGPLRLEGGPIVVEPQPAKHGGVGGMNLPRSGGQRLGPVGLEHSVEHLLGFGKILDPGEAVVVARVGHALFVHPSREPLATIHAHLDREGKPGLHVRGHEAEPPVDPVMVEELAFAVPRGHFEDFLFAVAVNLERPTRLDARQDADKSVGNAVFAGDPPGIIVLANAGRTKVVDGASRRFGSFQGGLDELIGHGLSVIAEILQQRANSGEIGGHAAGISEHPQRAAKNETVPTTQHPDDMVRVFWYKSVHGVPSLWANVSVQKHLPHNRGNAFFYPFWLRLRRAVFLLVAGPG